jgi:hypothetical protein
VQEVRKVGIHERYILGGGEGWRGEGREYIIDTTFFSPLEQP